MFRKNLCDEVSKMKNLRLLCSSFFRALRCGVLRFFCGRIFHRENRETKSPVLTFLKKAEKYGPKRGWKIEKRFFSSHPSSSAVRAGRFRPPNFFRGPPERRLISWSPNDRFWSFSIIHFPKVAVKSPVRFSTNPLASLGGLNKKVSTFEIYMKFKILSGYIFCISVEFHIEQVCPIQCQLANCTSKQTMTISKVKNDKIAVARSICLGSFLTRKETPLNFKI